MGVGRLSLIVPTRRAFLTGLASLFAAPAIVRASSLMPVAATDFDVLASFTYNYGNSILTVEELARAAVRLFRHSALANFEANQSLLHDFKHYGRSSLEKG